MNNVCDTLGYRHGKISTGITCGRRGIGIYDSGKLEGKWSGTVLKLKIKIKQQVLFTKMGKIKIPGAVLKKKPSRKNPTGFMCCLLWL